MRVNTLWSIVALFAVGASVGCGADVQYPPPPMPMQAEVSDAEVLGRGQVLIEVFGVMPTLPPDENGNTPVWTDDTSADAPIAANMRLFVNWPEAQASSNLLMGGSHLAALVQGEQQLITSMSTSTMPPAYIGRANPVTYRTTTDALIARSLTSIALDVQPDATVIMALGLGEALDAQTEQIAQEGHSPTSLMHLTGPLLLSCRVSRNGQIVDDERWQTPFCARVKAELGGDPALTSRRSLSSTRRRDLRAQQSPLIDNLSARVSLRRTRGGDEHAHVEQCTLTTRRCCLTPARLRSLHQCLQRPPG